jgi:hypothetical protein
MINKNLKSQQRKITDPNMKRAAAAGATLCLSNEEPEDQEHEQAEEEQVVDVVLLVGLGCNNKQI